MTAVEVLGELRQRGVTLEPNGDSLRYRAPKGVLTVELREALVENKAELIQLLSKAETSTVKLSSFQSDALSAHLLSRLQAGSRWLTAEHQAWLEDRKDAASDERFSVALDAWAGMERSLRLVYGYQGCVFGPSGRCPADAPVSCDRCLD